MSDKSSQFAEKAGRQKRLYHVEDWLTIVGVAEVEATTKAEVKALIEAGEVEFIYDDGVNVRRGDGTRIRLAEPRTSPDKDES